MVKLLHMQKKSYDGYCVGIGVEHPGIIVSGTTTEELVQQFKELLPGYEKAMQEYGLEYKPDIEIIPIDRE